MLKENRNSGVYPYHMPGHKRRVCGDLNLELCGIDITEIDGFDNLHQPTGILEKLQQQAARIYGAEESFYLVNGSTAGVLSAVSAVLPQGGHILMARNCHRSAYHGIYLRNLKVTYLYPSILAGYDMFDAVSPGQVQAALEEDPGIEAVLLVSPTYEGRISDIRRIAEIVHDRGIPLIVDEAHGAHLGLTGERPENSCQAGADVVIHSVHKTLPALTQSALLHVNGPRVNRERLRRFLRIYQTSSPSYLLMASIDNALAFMEREGKEAMRIFAERYEKMQDRLMTCKQLCVIPYERGRQDLGKLVISAGGAGITGKELYDILLHQYQLQTEMAAGSYVLAMFTVNDGQEAYERMTRALLEIDRWLAQRREAVVLRQFYPWAQEQSASEQTETGQFRNHLDLQEEQGLIQELISIGNPLAQIPLARAWDMETIEVELADSTGSCVGEFVNLYPPGIPVLVPGEQITESLCQRIQGWLNDGLSVQGVRRCGDKLFVKILVT